MPTLAENAPDLAPYITEEQAETLVTASAVGPKPAAKITDLAQLSANQRQTLLIWLKWYRSKRVPLEIAALQTLAPGFVGRFPSLAVATRRFLRLGPKVIARYFDLDPSFMASLISQVSALRAEVARGEDAWMPTAVTPVIESVTIDAPRKGDITITGTDFDSYDTKVTRVQVSRPDVGQVNNSQGEIEAAGGSVSPKQIVFPAGLLPAGGAKVGDLVRVRADGLDSVPYKIHEEPAPVEDPVDK